jgi:hypothetical protein
LNHFPLRKPREFLSFGGQLGEAIDKKKRYQSQGEVRGVPPRFFFWILEPTFGITNSLPLL